MMEEFTIPEWALGVIYNGANTDQDITQDEISRVFRFMERHNIDAEFLELSEPFFSWYNDISNEGGMCVTITKLK